MSDDLVKRLRGWAKDIQEGSTAVWAMDQDLKEAAYRIEELEANLAKAVEALSVIDALDPEALIDGCSPLALRGLVLRMGELARTTLAELKGETDE